MGNCSLILVRTIFTLSLTTILTACSTRWTKDGFTLQKWNVDNANCQREAVQMFPPQIISYQVPGYTEPVKTKCYNIWNSVNCTTTGGESYPITATKDLNKESRYNSWERCIRANGYYTVGEKNRSPRPSLPIKSSPIGDAFQEAKKASEDLCQRPKFKLFYKKVPCKVSDLTLEQLSDKSKASSNDKKVIADLQVEENKIANKVALTVIQHGNTKGIALAELIKRNIAHSDNLYLKLFNGECTFGEYNEMRQIMDLQATKDLKELASRP